MKNFKATTCLLLTAMIILSAFCFSSCSYENKLGNMKEDERAVELYNTSMANTENKAVKSYAADIKIDMTYKMSDIDVIMTGNTNMVYCIDGENISNLMSSEIEMNIPSMSVNNTIKQSAVYRDGKCSISYDDGTNVQKMYSSMTNAEYYAFIEELDSEINYSALDKITLADCETLKSTLGEDGEWTVCLNNLKGDALTAIKSLFSEDMTGDDSFNYDFSTASITEKVKPIKLGGTEKTLYLPTSMLVEFNFTGKEASSETATMKMDFTMSGWNTTSAPEQNLEGYTEVPDIRKLKAAENALDKIDGAKSGSFTVSTSNSTIGGGVDERSTETDDVTFGITDGNLTYNINALYNGTDITIKYSDGKQTITSGETNRSDDLDNDAAIAFLKSLMNPYDFSIYEAKSFTVSENGGKTTVVMKMKNCSELISSSLYENLGVRPETRSASAEITYDADGNITRLEYTATLTLKYNNNSYTVKYDATVTFNLTYPENSNPTV